MSLRVRGGTVGRTRPLGMVGLVAALVLAGAGLVGVSAGPVAASSSRGPWQRPVLLGFQPSALSCASSTFCMAIGMNEAGSVGKASTFDGTSWSKPATVNLVPPAPPAEAHHAEGLSCVSATFCMTVAGDEAMTYDGTSWSEPVQVPGADTLNALSCASSTFCVAGDTPGQLFFYNGDGWGAPESPGLALVAAVSCPSTSFCMAVGVGLSTTFNGTRWTHPRSDPASGNDVSCPAERACMSIGRGRRLVRAEFQGGEWGHAQQWGMFAPNLDPSLSCASRSFCVAVAADGASRVRADIGGFTGFPLFQTIAGFVDGSTTEVSCTSARFCMAVSTYVGEPTGLAIELDRG